MYNIFLTEMPIFILAAALLVLPLIAPFSFPFLPTIPDLWPTKDFMVLLFGLAIILRSDFSRNRNPWVWGFIMFLPISIYSSPPLRLIYGYQNLGGSWQWTALAWCLFYFMLHRAIAGTKISYNAKTMLARAIVWGAAISACYALLQAMGIDQFQTARTVDEIGLPQAIDIVANIGNPTYLSVYLGICLPFAIFYMRWAILPIVAVICIAQSDFAFYGSILTIGLMIALRFGRFWLKAYTGVGVLALVLMVGFWHQIKPFADQHSNGRLPVWKQTFEDWRTPCIKITVTPEMGEDQRKEIELLNKRNYVFTGRGPGSFPFIYSPKHRPPDTAPKSQVPFDTPHNVYLRILYELGLVGLVLFVGTIGWIFWQALKSPFDEFKIAVFCSAFFVTFCMIGTPVEVINPLAFFCVVIFSLL